MVHGSQAGLELLASITSDERLRRSHRLAVVRAHLLEMAGDRDAAGEAFRLAARLATNLPERRYLEAQVSRVAGLLDVEMGGLAPTG
jgi:predicted RNA polymerase sigma factor